MYYIIWFLTFVGAACILTTLAWIGIASVENYRYRKAINRRVAEIDREMAKRGRVL